LAVSQWREGKKLNHFSVSCDISPWLGAYEANVLQHSNAAEKYEILPLVRVNNPIVRYERVM
jgi:hypothetical protein